MFHGIPIYLEGHGGIGKSFLLHNITERLSKYPIQGYNTVNYGGLRNILSRDDKTLTILFEDAKMIIALKSDIRTHLMELLRTAMDYNPELKKQWRDGNYFDETKMGVDGREYKIHNRINFIIAGTHQHYIQFLKFRENDTLRRFAKIQVLPQEQQYKIGDEYRFWDGYDKLEPEHDRIIIEKELSELDFRDIATGHTRYLLQTCYETLRFQGYSKEESQRLCSYLTFYIDIAEESPNKKWDGVYKQVAFQWEPK